MKFELISENLQPLAVIYYTIGGGLGGPGSRSPYKPPKLPAGAVGGSSGPPPVLTAISHWGGTGRTHGSGRPASPPQGPPQAHLVPPPDVDFWISKSVASILGKFKAGT